MTLPDLAVALVGVLIVAALIVLRVSLVSLNKDMRAILDGQDKIRKRLSALEALTLPDKAD